MFSGLLDVHLFTLFCPLLPSFLLLFQSANNKYDLLCQEIV